MEVKVDPLTVSGWTQPPNSLYEHFCWKGTDKALCGKWGHLKMHRNKNHPSNRFDDNGKKIDPLRYACEECERLRG